MQSFAGGGTVVGLRWQFLSYTLDIQGDSPTESTTKTIGKPCNTQAMQRIIKVSTATVRYHTSVTVAKALTPYNQPLVVRFENSDLTLPLTTVALIIPFCAHSFEP